MRNKSRDVFTTIGARNYALEERQQDDYYATDPRAIDLLLKEEKFAPVIWECACGGGHLSKRLIENGYFVFSTDLIDRGYGTAGIDFLKSDIKYWNGEKALDYRKDIITNPPYKYAIEFVEHALDVVSEGRKVAMFLKLTFLEGKRRRIFFEKNPPKTVYVCSSRINCAKNGDFEKYGDNHAIAYAWYVWEKGYKGDPIIKWIN